MVESSELQKLRVELGRVRGENEELKARVESAERREEEYSRNMRDLVRHSVNGKGFIFC
jgi:phage shock protein A